MNRPLLLRRLFVLFAASAALLLRAADAPKAADQPKPAEPAKTESGPTPADQEVLKLPKVEVTSARIKAIDAELKKIDKQIAREKKAMKSTDLDKSLNSDKLSKSAAIFGGNSASHMEAVAATRVSMLENERAMLERLKFPRTEEDRALIEKELENIRKARRELDDAAKQR